MDASTSVKAKGKEAVVDVEEEVGYEATGKGSVSGDGFDDDVDFFEQYGELFVGVQSDDLF